MCAEAAELHESASTLSWSLRHSLPAFLLLAFWCHSVINKESEEPHNCLSTCFGAKQSL